MHSTWLAAAVVLGTTFGMVGVAEAGDGARHLPLGREAGALFSVKVAINGTGPYRFLVDTGSTRTLLSPETAEAAGVQTLAGARVVTPNGAREVRQGWVALALGRLAVDRLPVGVLPLDLAGKGATKVDGVLGNDVLRRANYVIDTKAGTLELLEEAAPAGRAAAGVPFVLDATGRMQVEVTTEWSAGTPVRLVLDSGASVVVLYKDRMPNTPAMQGAMGSARVRTVSSSSALQALRPGWVSAGATSWDGVAALVAPAASGTAAGLLPLSMMERVVVNNTDRTLTFMR